MPTLEQIQAKLKKLQAQADVLIARKAQAAVDQIRDLMLKHGLTTEDIEAKALARRNAKALNGHGANGRTKAVTSGNGKVAKYRDAKTGATWTGHGRAPHWIVSAKDRTQFLIEGASELKSAAKAAVQSVAKSAKGGKGQPKGAQPPKYRDPKSGATWSGRGPAPAWLATVKDRTKYLIDGASAAVSSAAPKAAAKAAKAKSAARSGVVSKKAAAKIVVTAKKSAVAKTVKKATAAAGKTAAKKSAAKPAVKKTAARKAPGRKAAPKADAGATTSAAVPAQASAAPASA